MSKKNPPSSQGRKGPTASHDEPPQTTQHSTRQATSTADIDFQPPEIPGGICRTRRPLGIKSHSRTPSTQRRQDQQRRRRMSNPPPEGYSLPAGREGTKRTTTAKNIYTTEPAATKGPRLKPRQDENWTSER